MSDVLDISPPIFAITADRGKSRWIIYPDISRCEQTTHTKFDNTWTVHYSWMIRQNLDTGEACRAHVNTKTYRFWLDCHENEDGIPPHIQFGGAVESGEPDPEFYNRWKAYARKAFC